MRAIQIFTANSPQQGFVLNDYRGFQVDPAAGLVEFVGGSGGSLVALTELKLAIWGEVEPTPEENKEPDIVA